MARTYIKMLNLAVDKQQAFNKAHDFALKHPDNLAAEREEMRKAADLCGYCDAIADMFGKGYDDVYQDVHDFTEAIESHN